MSVDVKYKSYKTREKMAEEYNMPRFEFDNYVLDQLEINETKFYLFMTSII